MEDNEMERTHEGNEMEDNDHGGEGRIEDRIEDDGSTEGGKGENEEGGDEGRLFPKKCIQSD